MEGVVLLILGIWLLATVKYQIVLEKRLKTARQQTAEANRRV